MFITVCFLLQYASVLITLVIVQVIIVAYFFSDPNRISKFIVISMTKSLEFYGVDGASGEISTAIWNLTMNVCSHLKLYHVSSLINNFVDRDR